jgi:FixJ family two-component response regulator/chemotaxis methyl-accepting protein methylase/signal transduction histidine kinase
MANFRAQENRPGFPVVGIGASAGGLEACQRLLAALSGKTGMAFILIQHLDPGHASLMAELLAGHTRLRVAEAAEGMRLEPDHLYLIPPGTLLSLANGGLHLAPAPGGHALRLPFDHLLRSMAAELGPRAVAVVLTGTGADGSAALGAIRAAGGSVLVQDPQEAAFDGMPRSAIATGQATLIAPLAGLAAALMAQAQAVPGLAPANPTADVRAAIIELLRRNTRHDFSLYKPGTVQRRIEHRIGLLSLAEGDLPAYLALLQTDRAELDLLAQDLLINVTSFFRDAEVFELLKADILPALVRNHPGPQPIRVWVVGCSTGQEAYSLAMLFHEVFEAERLPAAVQIFATDADAHALAQARDGFYLDTTGISKTRLAQHFTAEGAGFRVAPALRASVTFAQHDVLADLPFARLDLLSCRNLMIYLAPEAQDRLLEVFHLALRDGGLMLLGKAETAGAPDRRFQTVSDAARLYRNHRPLRPSGRNALSLPGNFGPIETAAVPPRQPPERLEAVAPSLGPKARLRAARPGQGKTALDTPETDPAVLAADLAGALGELDRARQEHAALRQDALSVTEEYQAANEELLASKEELQSLNEELTALNSQLQETLEKQRTASDDLQNVLYSTNVATLFLDPELNIRFFTPATRMLFSLRAGDVGRPLADLAPLSSDSTLLADARKVLAGEPVVEREIEAQAGSWFSRRVLPYKTATGRIAGVVITYTEVTERRKIHEALAAAERVAQHANAAKTRFLEVASHDLRQPLQTMVILQGLLMNAVSGAHASDLVGRLGEMLAAMARMLDVLLDINQIEAGAIRPERSVFSVNDIFERLKAEFTYTARAKGLKLRMVPCSIEVNSDPDLLEQMLRNLLSNALKYTSKGKVLLGCRRRGAGVVIELWDTGIGIEQSDIKAVFEEYRQVNNPARERSKGLGLGLSIVQRLGRLLGHKVGAASTPGRGSVFTIEIANIEPPPPVQSLPVPEVAPKRAAPITDKARILIVEDDPEVRELLDLLLRDRGHETLLAEDGPAALALVAEAAAPPDLVLTDYNLPGGLNGLALAEELRRAIQREVPAIVLTGDISTLAMRRISQRDVVHLAKPVTVDRLTKAVTDLLGPLPAIPAAPVPADAPEPGPEPAVPARKVFLVDDDDALRASLGEMLREAGHEVFDYATAEAFLAGYVSGSSGCLLIDAYLPGISGIDLLEQIKARTEPLASIMITGRSDVAIAVMAMQAGALDFVEKPISGPDLLARIEAVGATLRDVGGDTKKQAARAARLAALTPRQRQVLDAVLAGKASKNIAFDLDISQRTVESHRAAIMEKLGARSVPALVRLALGGSL